MFVARAGADPEAEGDRADAGDTLGDHALARRELGELMLRHAAGSYPSSESLRRSFANRRKERDSGSDPNNYIAKPFDADELVARVRAALRRADPSAKRSEN